MGVVFDKPIESATRFSGPQFVRCVVVVATFAFRFGLTGLSERIRSAGTTSTSSIRCVLVVVGVVVLASPFLADATSSGVGGHVDWLVKMDTIHTAPPQQPEQPASQPCTKSNTATTDGGWMQQHP